MGTPQFGQGLWASGVGVGLKFCGRGTTRYSVTLLIPDKSLVRVGASRPITNSYFFLIAEAGFARSNVRFGSKADICSAQAHARFTPKSDRESGLPAKVMSALPQERTCAVHYSMSAKGHKRTFAPQKGVSSRKR